MRLPDHLTHQQPLLEHPLAEAIHGDVHHLQIDQVVPFENPFRDQIAEFFHAVIDFDQKIHPDQPEVLQLLKIGRQERIVDFGKLLFVIRDQFSDNFFRKEPFRNDEIRFRNQH